GPAAPWRFDPGFDLGRIRRQQVLLRALAARALRQGLTNPLRADAILTAVAGHLTRDDTLTVGRAVRLAGELRRFRPGALTGLTIPTRPARLGDGEQVLLPVQPATRQTVARFLGRPEPAARHRVSSAPDQHPATPAAWDPRPC